MTAAAVILLVLTAVTPVLPAALRHRRARRDPAGGDATTRTVDAAAAVLLVVLAAVTAAAAARAGDPVRGPVAGLVLCATVAAAVGGGGFVVRAVLAAGGVNGSGGVHAHPVDNEAGDPGADTQPLRGGRVIGYLERTAVAVTLLIGWPEGLAVILAVKSLARYPELRAPHASEQFIMGTFASVLWASALAGIGYLLLY